MNDLAVNIVNASRSLEIHLLCASLVWLAAWLLTAAVRRGTVTWKYWIWVATSLNFLLPLSAVLDRLWPGHPSSTAEFTAFHAMRADTAPGALPWIWSLWALGAILMSARLWLRYGADRAAGRQGPAVHGLLRPRIVLPEGIEQVLSEHELNAVLIHERVHARRHDNLIGLIHEVSLCLLWFHPLVWITGRRLALYRELSCDDAVIRKAHGGHLLSALARLAVPENAYPLYAAASSLVEHRLGRLAEGPLHRASFTSNALSVAVFSVVLLAGVFGAGAQVTHSSAQERSKAPATGVTGGISGGITGGVSGGVSGGVPGGVSGGISGGVSGGVNGGVN